MNNETQSAFAQLGIPALLVKNLNASGITVAKPIQEQAIVPMLAGRDILGVAQTGSGKTLAFSLPILAKIMTMGDKRIAKTARALILAPTRELAVQIEEAIRNTARGAHLSTALVLGGMSRQVQIKRMALGIDILIATPGRLMDLVRDSCVDLSHTEFLVLDEADRMLDMGFIKDVQHIAKLVRPTRQTALFSATMPKVVANLAEGLLRQPVRVEVAPHSSAAPEITQVLHEVATRDKKTVLSALLTDPEFKSVIVFTRTKHGADAVSRHLVKTGYSVGVIHGNKTQNARQKALKSFRDGLVKVLVATDIAARGIDIPGISHVVNFDLPDEAESYVHRIGRTGRNGATGCAITLLDGAGERARLRAVERITRSKVDRQIVPPQFGPLPPKPSAAILEQQDQSNKPKAFRPKRVKGRAVRRERPNRNGRSGAERQAGPQSDHKSNASKATRRRKFG